MKIEYAVPHPEKKHVLHVGLLYEAGVDSVEANIVREIPVRASHYNSLTAAKKLAYAQQCAEFHIPFDRAKAAARRAAWDADDKARADTAALAAKQAQEAVFDYKATGIVTDKEGNKVEIQATVNYHGLTWSGTVPYTTDKGAFKASLEAAFAEYEAKVNAEKAELAVLA